VGDVALGDCDRSPETPNPRPATAIKQTNPSTRQRVIVASVRRPLCMFRIRQRAPVYAKSGHLRPYFTLRLL